MSESKDNAPDIGSAIAAQERVEDPKIALQREILDPKTTTDRLEEIQRLLRDGNEGDSLRHADALNEMTNDELVALLKDGSTPLETLEEILEIAKSRESKSLPPQQ